MNELIQEALRITGDTSKILDVRPVSGGTINQAFYLKTKSEEYFFKYNNQVEKEFFQKEANSLRTLQDTQTINVPEVYTVDTLNDGSPFILMEWISGSPTSQTETELGWGIAQLHQTLGEHFGFHENNYIGLLLLENGWYSDWITFYREKRLRPQMVEAEKRGRVPHSRRKRLEYLLEHLHRWIPSERQASLIHGDLWGGNWITGPHGKPYLIDPVVCYADAELELSFTEFGGFSQRFYEAYHEIRPISPEYEERKPLYQLYYLLVHLNIVGEIYGARIDQVLKRYTW